MRVKEGCPEWRCAMRVGPFGHLDAGADLSGTAAQRGDGLVVLGLLVIVVIVIAIMGSIASDKRKVLKTNDKAPRTGEYRAEARAYHGAGRMIGPPSNERCVVGTECDSFSQVRPSIWGASVRWALTCRGERSLFDQGSTAAIAQVLRDLRESVAWTTR
jgi:hypothetical protein